MGVGILHGDRYGYKGGGRGMKTPRPVRIFALYSPHTYIHKVYLLTQKLFSCREKKAVRVETYFFSVPSTTKLKSNPCLSL